MGRVVAGEDAVGGVFDGALVVVGTVVVAVMWAGERGWRHRRRGDEMLNGEDLFLMFQS